MAGRLISRFQFALSADTRTFNREMRRGSRTITDQERAVRSLQRSLNRTSEGFRRFQRNVLSLRGALVSVAAVGGFLRLAQESTKAATSLVELADRTGFTTDRLQTLGRVMEGDGVSAEQFGRALGFMNRAIADAGNGLSTQVRTLEKLGLTYSDIEDLAPEQQFDLIAERIANLTKETDRAEVSARLFGTRAEGFINVLQRGTDHLRDQEAAFRALGITNEEGLRALKELNQEFTNISTTLRVSLQRSFADSADELSVLLRQLQELIRAGTPLAIDVTSGAIGAVQSVADNAGAVQGGILGYLGLRATGSLASGLNTAARALGGAGGFNRALVAATARIAAVSPALAPIVAIGTLLYTFRDQVSNLVNDFAGIRSTDFTPQRLRGAPDEQRSQLEEIIRNTEMMVEGIEGLGLEGDSRRFLAGIVDDVQDFGIFNRENIDNLFTRLENQRFLYLGDDDEGRNRLIQQQARDFVREALAGFRQRLQDLPAASTQPTTTTTATTDEFEQQRIEREELNRLEEIRRANTVSQLAIEKAVSEALESQLDVTQRILELRLTEGSGGGDAIRQRIDELNLEFVLLQSRLNEINAIGVDKLHDDFVRTTEQVTLLEQEIEGLEALLESLPDTVTSLQGVGEFGQGLVESRIRAYGIALGRDSLLQGSEFQAVSDYFLEQNLAFGAVQSRISVLGEVTSDWFQGMKDGFEGAILQTDSFGEALRRLARYGIARAIGLFFSEDVLGRLFGGIGNRTTQPTPTNPIPFQRGGYIRQGQLGLVGEDGPELFIPRFAGSVVPLRSESSGRGSTSIVFNIESTDGPGVRAALNTAIPRLKEEVLKLNDNSNLIQMSRRRDL